MSCGKWYWLREYIEGKVKWNQKMVDIFLVCTTCEICNLRCSSVLPIGTSWQMPELMPKMMGNLMPQMLPNVVPLVTPKLIQYITAAD